mgnify:CR=1 FL=1
MNSIFSQIGRDAIVLFIGTALTKSVGLFLMPLYTHTFSMEEYGTIEIVNISAQILGIIMAFGMPSAFDREFLQLSDTDEERKKVISTSFLFLFIFGLLVTTIAYMASEEFAVYITLR